MRASFVAGLSRGLVRSSLARSCVRRLGRARCLRQIRPAVLDHNGILGVDGARLGEQLLRLLPVSLLPRLARLLHQLRQPVLARQRDRDRIIAVPGIQFLGTRKLALGPDQVVPLELVRARQICILSLPQMPLAGRCLHGMRTGSRQRGPRARPIRRLRRRSLGSA